MDAAGCWQRGVRAKNFRAGGPEMLHQGTAGGRACAPGAPWEPTQSPLWCGRGGSVLSAGRGTDQMTKDRASQVDRGTVTRVPVPLTLCPSPVLRRASQSPVRPSLSESLVPLRSRCGRRAPPSSGDRARGLAVLGASPPLGPEPGAQPPGGPRGRVLARKHVRAALAFP